ncbi:hypothetical protein ACFQLX_24385, partial [Streptomyces polyrhachis]
RGWRRRAPIEALMPLKLARYGVPLAQTSAEGLAAAGIDVPQPSPVLQQQPQPALDPAPAPTPAEPPEPARPLLPAQRSEPPLFRSYEPASRPDDPEPVGSPASAAGAGRRSLGTGRANGHRPAPVPQFMAPPPLPEPEPYPEAPFEDDDLHAGDDDPRGSLPDDIPLEDAYYGAFLNYLRQVGVYPSPTQFALYLQDHHGVQVNGNSLWNHIQEFRQRYEESQTG